MPMNRVRCVWSGFPGAPGYSNMYVSTSVVNQGDLQDFFSALEPDLPSAVRIDVPQTGDVIDESTGQITGTWAGTPNGQIVGTQAGVYSAPSGAVVNWKTALLVEGRRVQGRTFLVPLAGTAYQADGSLASATQARIQAAATALVVALAGSLKIWSRPRPTIAGANATVLAGVVPDMAAVLSSRRP